jgi:hypothetical protein
VINVPLGGGTLTFKNLFNLETGSTVGYDGMVLEISINGGAYSDITSGGNAFTAGGYNKTISANFSSAIAGRQAWSGLSGGTTAAPTYIDSSIALPAAAAGQPIRLKWRVSTDSSAIAAGVPGVRIDDIAVIGNTAVCSGPGAPNTNPTVSTPSTQSINEDAATSAVAVTINDAETPLGNLVLAASSNNTALVPNAPANLALGGSAGSRTIIVTPLPNMSGTATITLTVTDGGALTATSTFDVVVAPVNDAPSFLILGDRTHVQGTPGLQTIAGFVTGTNFGPSESGQTVVGYTVSELSDPANAVSGAAISPAGVLTYTLAGTPGVATIRVTMQDSGGTANGGVDTSAPVDFTITTVPVDVFKDGFE